VGADASVFTDDRLPWQHVGCALAGSLRLVAGFPDRRLLRTLRPTLVASADDGLARLHNYPVQGWARLGWFPRSPSTVWQVRCPAMPQRHCHEYAAGLPRGLGADDIHGNRVARLPSVRRNPAHIRQVEAGGLALEGLWHWFLTYTVLPRLPSARPSGSADRPRRCRGCLPSRQAVSPGQTAPSFVRLLRQPGSGVLSPPHG
jgi:hypothetical protein